jgi:putative ABC transport system permease protein
MTAWALARRDLRGGLGGLGLLLACLAIAIAGLAAVTSVADAIRSSIDANSRNLLGADLVLSTAQREATAEERAAMAELGPAVVESKTLRSNLLAPGGSALVELSAVPPGWPPAGAVRFDRGRAPGDGEAAVGRELAERFNLRLGSPVRLGYADFRVSGIVGELPAVSGFALAPPVLITPAGLGRSGLIQPGSLYTSSYRLLLPPGQSGLAVGKAFQARFPEGGWRALDKGDAAGGTRRFVDRVGQLLLLIALGALGVGAIGISGAASAFAASRRPRIAVLKILGARRADLLRMLGLAVAVLAAAAIGFGLLLGSTVPAVVGWAAADLLPVALDPAPQWRALLLSGAFGVLVTLAAAWRPIATAVAERPAGILRGEVGGAERLAARSWLVPLLATLGVAALAVWSASDRWLTVQAFVAAAALAGLFAALGWAVRGGARALRGRGGPIARLGIAALHRPGSATVRLSIALGLGLALLVALSGIGRSLSAELRGSVPQRAPALFTLDIPSDSEARFRGLAARTLPGAELRIVPSLRGSVTALNGQPVSALSSVPEGGWILRGDRGLTFARSLPEGNRVVAGNWWPADYRGPPLVSLDAEAARALKLGVGDTITVAVLGRPIEARIASLREIDWRSLGFNFALIFAPGTLEQAPYTLMATVAPTPGSSTLPLERALAAELPMVSVIRVAEVVERAAVILRAMDAAITLATAIAILIGVAVLAGAVAATRASRARESVLLKLVGATRRQVLAAQLIEFLGMSGAVALAAFLLGSAAAWAAVTQLFELPFRPGWAGLAALPLAGVAVAVATALAAALPALRARPAEALRSY